MMLSLIYFQIEDLRFILLLIPLIILSVLYAFYYKNSRDLVLSFLGPRYSNIYLRDDNIFKKISRSLLLLFTIINISIFIWIAQKNFDESFSNLIIIIGGVLSYYIIKYILYRFLGTLIRMEQIANIGWFFTTLFDQVSSIISYPFLVAFYFFVFDIQDYSISAIYIIYFLFFLLKLFWIFRIGIKSFGLSKFYLFLYICCLEFFPILLVLVGFIF